MQLLNQVFESTLDPDYRPGRRRAPLAIALTLACIGFLIAGSATQTVQGEPAAAQERQRLIGLVEGARAVLLPEIAAQFDALKRAHESVLKVRIVSAMPLADADRDDLVAELSRKYGRRIEATVEVDATLIGGARVHVGDEVIHASMRDALAQMAVALAR